MQQVRLATPIGPAAADCLLVKSKKVSHGFCSFHLQGLVTATATDGWEVTIVFAAGAAGQA